MIENRLLSVDDDPRISRLVQRVAEKIGFDTMAINDSTEFESAYRDFKPDVILLDLNMPGTDGIELLRFLAGRQSRTAIFLISGVDTRVIATTIRLGQELGLDMAGEQAHTLFRQRHRARQQQREVRKGGDLDAWRNQSSMTTIHCIPTVNLPIKSSGSEATAKCR